MNLLFFFDKTPDMRIAYLPADQISLLKLDSRCSILATLTKKIMGWVVQRSKLDVQSSTS